MPTLPISDYLTGPFADIFQVYFEELERWRTAEHVESSLDGPIDLSGDYLVFAGMRHFEDQELAFHGRHVVAYINSHISYLMAAHAQTTAWLMRGLGYMRWRPDH